MRIAQIEQPSWIVQPAVVLTMAYGGVIACWFLYLTGTLRHPSIFDDGPHRMIGKGSYWAFTGANLTLALSLLASLEPARRADRATRRGQIAGITLALGLLAVLQLGAQALGRDTGSRRRTGADAIATFLASRSQGEQQVIACVRDALKSAQPEAREALWQGELHHDDAFASRVSVTSGEVRVILFHSTGRTPSIEEGPWSLARDSNGRSITLVIPCPLDDSELEHLRAVMLSLSAQGKKRQSR